MLGEDIFRIGAGSVNYFVEYDNTAFLNSRRKFVSQIGLGLAAIPFIFNLDGHRQAQL
jgi:hypothetical protein